MKIKNPDGSDLTLYTCDDHYTDLTGELRRAGTKYTLSPVNGPHTVGPEPPLDEFKPIPDETPGVFPEPTTKLGKFLYNSACIATGLVIGPFILVYLGGRWILGWRPSNLDDL